MIANTFWKHVYNKFNNNKLLKNTIKSIVNMCCQNYKDSLFLRKSFRHDI